MEQTDTYPEVLTPVANRPASPWFLDLPTASPQGMPAGIKQREVVRRRRPFLYIKEGKSLVKLHLREILLLRADLNYVEVLACHDRRFVVRTSLCSLMEQLPPRFFQQVSRNTVVNLIHLQAIQGNNLTVGPHTVRLSRSLRPELFNRLKIVGCR